MLCLWILFCIQFMNYSKGSFSAVNFSNQFPNYYLTSTKLDDKFIKNPTNGLSWCFMLNYTDKMEIEICLRHKQTRVMNTTTNIIIYDTSASRTIVKEKYSGLVEGFVKSEKNFSHITGYIRTKYFYGKMGYRNNSYYFEELAKFPWLSISSQENAIVFHSDSSFDINYNEPWPDFANKFRRSYADEELFKILIGKGKVCNLFVLLDYSFLTLIHKNDVNSAVEHALSTIEEANSLFRSTDFDNDGSPDNIGFFIKYCIILKAENSAMNLLPKYSKDAINGRIYLKMFSRYNLLSEVCLGIVFTGQAFQKDIVGISYSAVPKDPHYFSFPIGGICDRPLLQNPAINLNTLAVSARSSDGKLVPKYIFDLSLAHELGHSFGSDHDQGKNCEGYLMNDHTPENLDRKHFVFSSCSKRMILNTIVNRGHCFEDDDISYCGNGRLESLEECDCGTIRDCEEFDACCIPRGKPNSCKIRKDQGFQCHPSQGLCCSSKCKYRDLSTHNLNCKDFQRSCPCDNESSDVCSCGIKGTCVNNTCNSDECVRINMKECECSRETIKLQKCSTCCLFNDSCLPSSIITTKFLESKTAFVEKHDYSENGKRADTSYKQFCNPDGNHCVLFDFREVLPGGYCLLFGKLGICNTSYKCILPENHKLYPDIPTAKMRKSSGGKYSIQFSQYDVLCLYFLHFAIIKVVF